jgi:deoxyadenosine/deoxycytidine kinase
MNTQTTSNTQTRTRPAIVAIEGNIGAGKSTILDNLRREFENKGIHAVFMPEPVDIWSTITDDKGETILSKYYADPVRYAFPFQMMAYTTRLSILRRTIQENPGCDVIVCERSLEADHQIFAKMLFDDKMIEYVQYSVYKWLYDDTAKEYATDGIVYLMAEPSRCLERIRRRQREGESNIPVEYLEKCRRYYDDWLLKDYAEPERVIQLDVNMDVVYDGTDEVANRWIQHIIDFVFHNMCYLQR